MAQARPTRKTRATKKEPQELTFRSRSPTVMEMSSSSRQTIDADAYMAGTDHDRGNVAERDYPSPSSFEHEAQRSTSTSQQHVSNNHSAGELSHIVGDVTQLMQSMDKLEELGIEKFDIDLPKIVVVGDQSHGKSSLLEAICDVQVLRKSGLCTRAPLHMSIHPADEFFATITLHKVFTYLENREGDAGYGPWLRMKSPEIIPFMEVPQKAGLEDALNRAQLAILSPKRDPAEFLCQKPKLPKSGHVDFSPNIIRLEIRAPGLPDLSFYDMPGLIAAPEKPEDQYLIDLIAELSREYIKMPNSIILLACSMEVDRATVYASKLIQEANAADRCIGVLTKPDRLAHGSDLETWKDILRGKIYKLKHGYYVTRGSTQEELNNNISHQDARQREKDFFRTNKIWSRDLATFQASFGTSALQSKLSELLRDEIRKSIPKIAEQIGLKIQSVEEELAQLPAPPSENPLMTISELLYKFGSEVQTDMQGDFPSNKYRVAWKNRLEDFCGVLKDSHPALLLKAAQDEEIKKSVASEPILVVSDDEETTTTPSSNSRKRPATGASAPITPSKRPRTAQSATPQRRNGSSRFSLDDIRKTLQQVSVSNIPNSADPRAEETLIQESTKHWEEFLQDLLATTGQDLHEHVQSLVYNHFSKWSNTELAAETPKLVAAYLETIISSHNKLALRSLQAERLKPFTLNEEWIAYQQQKEQDFLRGKRIEHLTRVLIEAEEAQSNRVTEGKARVDKIKLYIAKNNVRADPYVKELEVMSRVRAYYNVAAAQLVDQIGKSMQLEVFEQVKKDLLKVLQNGLGVFAADNQARCARLLAEDPVRAERREHVKMEHQKLLEAKATIEALWTA